MSEMVERVARALSDSRQIRAYGRVMTMWRAPEMAPSFIEERLVDARAAIEAMREPTDKMVEGGNEIENPCDMCMGSIVVAEEVWRAMIDEALR